MMITKYFFQGRLSFLGGCFFPLDTLRFTHGYMGVEPKIRGKPPKWMAYVMENPLKMDDLGGVPIIFGSTPK